MYIFIRDIEVMPRTMISKLSSGIFSESTNRDLGYGIGYTGSCGQDGGDKRGKRPSTSTDLEFAEDALASISNKSYIVNSKTCLELRSNLTNDLHEEVK